jgi:hypothetical protein
MTADQHRCRADLLRGAENGWIVAADVGFNVGNVRSEWNSELLRSNL